MVRAAKKKKLFRDLKEDHAQVDHLGSELLVAVDVAVQWQLDERRLQRFVGELVSVDLRMYVRFSVGSFQSQVVQTHRVLQLTLADLQITSKISYKK